MHSERRGNAQKSTSDKTFQTKYKNPDKNPREQLRENLYRGLLSGFCTRPIKNGVSKMCDVLLGGVPGCDRGGAKLAKNSVTYFMDGPCNSRGGGLGGRASKKSEGGGGAKC